MLPRPPDRATGPKTTTHRDIVHICARRDLNCFIGSFVFRLAGAQGMSGAADANGVRSPGGVGSISIGGKRKIALGASMRAVRVMMRSQAPCACVALLLCLPRLVLVLGVLEWRQPRAIGHGSPPGRRGRSLRRGAGCSPGATPDGGGLNAAARDSMSKQWWPLSPRASRWFVLAVWCI